MTVDENVGYGPLVQRRDKTAAAKLVAETLDIVGLMGFRDRYPSQLSGGQKQRVALARAIVCEPKVILLDEPLAALDATLRRQMQIFLKQIQRRIRTTFVFVTHDQDEAITMSDRIVVMSQGRIEQAGSPEDIYERPESEFVARFIGGTNILKGRGDSDRTVVVPDGPVLRCGSGEVASGGDTAVSIRHHDITLTPEQPADGQTNAAPGTVQRQIYLGSHRDYLVTLRNNETVRAVAPVNVAIPVGAPVWLKFPEQHGRALAR
jgi:iron(III) transport system ATP-binding protein